MPLTPPSNEDIETSSATPILMQLPHPLLDYRITIAVAKGDVGAVNILKDATFTDNFNSTNDQLLTVVQPNHLTDLSLNIERLSKTRDGRVPLIIGDFLDNVLSVCTAPASLPPFLCRLHQIQDERKDRLPLSHRRHARLKENSHTQMVRRRHDRIQRHRGHGRPQTRSTHPRPSTRPIRVLGQRWKSNFQVRRQILRHPKQSPKFWRPQHFLFEEPIKTY